MPGRNNFDTMKVTENVPSQHVRGYISGSEGSSSHMSLQRLSLDPGKKRKRTMQQVFVLNAFHLKDCHLLQDYFLTCFDVKMFFYEMTMVESGGLFFSNIYSWQNKMLATRFQSSTFLFSFSLVREIEKSGTHSKVQSSLRIIHKEIKKEENLENSHAYQKDKSHRCQGRINAQKWNK